MPENSPVYSSNFCLVTKCSNQDTLIEQSVWESVNAIIEQSAIGLSYQSIWFIKIQFKFSAGHDPTLACPIICPRVVWSVLLLLYALKIRSKNIPKSCLQPQICIQVCLCLCSTPHPAPTVLVKAIINLFFLKCQTSCQRFMHNFPEEAAMPTVTV